VTCDHVELARVLLAQGARIDTLDQDATDTATLGMRALLKRAAVADDDEDGAEEEEDDEDGAEEEDDDDAPMHDADDGLGA